MADVNIGAKITVDTGNTQQDIKGVTTELGNASTAAKKASGDHKELTGGFASLKEQLTKVPGATGEAAEGVGKLGQAFKILLANPVVLIIAAIVAALSLLYKAFSSTYEGGKQMEQVFEGIKAAAQVVVDRLVMFGNAVIKFFSGDFKGAMADAKGSVSGVGDEISKVYNRTVSLTKQLQGIRKEERADELEKAERSKRLALLREQLNDESVPIAKRKAAAKELKEDEEKNAVEDLDRAKRKAAIQIALLTQQKDGERKNAEEINKIKIDVLNTERENALEQVRTNKVIRNLEKQDAAAQREEAAKRKKDLEDIKKAEDEAYKAYLNRVNSRLNSTIVSEKELHDSEEALRKEKEAKEKQALADQLERQRKSLEGAKGALIDEAEERNRVRALQLELDKAAAEQRIANISTVGTALSQLSELAGQQTVLGKGLAIASSIINTYQGATKALAQGGIFGAISAAGVIAAGLASVQKIASVQVPGATGGGSSSAPSVSAPAPIQPQAQTTVINPNQVNQIGNAAARAYVLEADVRSNQERIERINRAARIG